MREILFEVDNYALDIVKNLQIRANFAETKAALEELTAPYKNLIVTADMVDVAKSDRAKIRKVENSIDEYRKTVKRMYSRPLAEFEEKCKELTSICKDASDNLDEQVKEFENAEKQKKIDTLEFFFQEQPKKHGDFISFMDVYDERWKNVTFSIDSAKEIICEAIKKTDTEVDIIKALNSPFEVTLLYEYKVCHDITKVLQQKAVLEEEAKKEIERAKAEAAVKAKETPQASVKPVVHDLSPNRILIELAGMDSKTKAKLVGFLIKSNIPYREIM